MKLFHLYRVEDQTGVSGTGPVVEGVEFTNGWCAIRWMSDRSSICFYKSIEDVEAIHGHGGRTEVVVHDLETLERWRPGVAGLGFDVFMEIIEETSRLLSTKGQGLEDPSGVGAAIGRIHSLVDRLGQLLGGSRAA